MSSLSCADPLRDTTRDQLTQHRMQPAGHLGPGPAQIPVPLGPYLQHRRVIISGYLPAGGRAQCRDRHRPGVVGVVLVHRPSRQQPDPGAELRLHIQHLLTNGQQLLGQQVPQPGGALDSPGPLRPGRRPRQQPLRLRRRGAHPHLTQRLLRRPDRHRGVRALVRIHPDHHSHHERPPIDAGVTVAGMPYFRDPSGVRASFEPRHGEEPTGWHVVNKPGRKQPAGGSRASPSDL